ncbi:alpha/beta hydrolase [Nonomuraea sp. NEAU-A123]|uniref:alpha/beta hydrolase n=1 Tax=Nonomuraea sp. NEAU-A123 TaxID=2839649 RepID=UPI001BE3E3E8|nr:alpha/beta hydrolase [Nonomuraea sp. NEAU-A123]MBT2231969.1 alpha/beta hydrolase [Nonomuraea sp. NEAU-A123]
MTVEHIMFRSGDVRCAADLYLPDDTGEAVPGVVMGHSVHMVKEALAPSAAYLVRAGFAVLAIDYRTIGASEGLPRGQVFPQRYVDDVRNGVSFLASRPEVDPARIGLWGHSLGATVMIQAAAIDRRVTCVVCQNPSMFSGWRAMEKARGRPGVQTMLDAVDRDRQQRYETGTGIRTPLLGNGDSDIADYLQLAKEVFPTFDDEVEVESLAQVLLWAPEAFIDRVAPRPLLMVTGREDLTHDIGEVLDAYAKAREPKQLELLPFDERGLSVEPGLGQSMTIAVEWFDRHLRQAPRFVPSPPASEVRTRGLRPEFLEVDGSVSSPSVPREAGENPLRGRG